MEGAGVRRPWPSGEPHANTLAHKSSQSSAMDLTPLITPLSTSYAAFHGHLLALTAVVVAGNVVGPWQDGHADTLAHKSSQAATMVLTPPIARTPALCDAFKGCLPVLVVTDASGNVVVECRRSFGWGLGLQKGRGDIWMSSRVRVGLAVGVG
ncbi:hypothetical protein BJ165DRAFT_870335 [Panaeolus papilionaceus]|nr:hypothetical protein BJ165DRAFT_870335 [Panaeolus papilionaceus]